MTYLDRSLCTQQYWLNADIVLLSYITFSDSFITLLLVLLVSLIFILFLLAFRQLVILKVLNFWFSIEAVTSSWFLFLHITWWISDMSAILSFIDLLCSFIKAKSEVCLEDVGVLVEIGLELFHKSHSKLYAQVWHCILKLLSL